MFKAIQTIFFFIGCVIALPVIVPYALITYTLADRRRKRDADNFCCIQCSNILGQTSIAIADEYWHEYVHELHKRSPEARLRLVRDVWAICAVCGGRYNCRTRDKTYILNPGENNSSMVSGDE